MAERHVKTAKALLTKAQLSGQDLMMVEEKNIYLSRMVHLQHNY